MKFFLDTANIDEIIENNLSSFKGKFKLNKDKLININW